MENEGIGNFIAEGLVPAATAAPAAPAPEPSPAAAPAAAPAPADTSTAAPAPVPATDPAAPPAAPVAAAPAPVDGKTVPLPAFLDMRDENKTLKARLAELEAKTAANPPAPMPSFKDDPEGLAAYMAEHTNRVAIGTKFDVSEMTAREKHGDDVVTAAMEWGLQQAHKSPVFAADYLKQKNPIDWIVKEQKRKALHEEVDTDPDAYVRKRAAELGLVATAAAPAPANPSPAAAPASPQPAPSAAPPRSIATAPSAGGPQQVPTGPLAAFDAVFPGP